MFQNEAPCSWCSWKVFCLFKNRDISVHFKKTSWREKLFLLILLRPGSITGPLSVMSLVPQHTDGLTYFGSELHRPSSWSIRPQHHLWEALLSKGWVPSLQDHMRAICRKLYLKFSFLFQLPSWAWPEQGSLFLNSLPLEATCQSGKTANCGASPTSD